MKAFWTEQTKQTGWIWKVSTAVKLSVEQEGILERGNHRPENPHGSTCHQKFLKPQTHYLWWQQLKKNIQGMWKYLGLAQKVSTWKPQFWGTCFPFPRFLSHRPISSSLFHPKASALPGAPGVRGSAPWKFHSRRLSGSQRKPQKTQESLQKKKISDVEAKKPPLWLFLKTFGSVYTIKWSDDRQSWSPLALWASKRFQSLANRSHPLSNSKETESLSI